MLDLLFHSDGFWTLVLGGVFVIGAILLCYAVSAAIDRADPWT